MFSKVSLVKAELLPALAEMSSWLTLMDQWAKEDNMEVLIGLAITLVGGGSLAFCIISGAIQSDFALIAIGATPLAAALGAVVAHYFDAKQIDTVKAENKALKSENKALSLLNKGG
jgi:hypothetical protein